MKKGKPKKKNVEFSTNEELMAELKWLEAEGFIVYNPVDQTYRMKTEEEIENEISEL